VGTALGRHVLVDAKTPPPTLRGGARWIYPSAMVETEAVHPNVLSYKRMIAAFNANDLSAVQMLVGQELAYTIPGKSLLACQTLGIAPHLEMLKRARDLSGGTLRLEPRAVACDGEYLMIFGRITAQRAGKTFDSDHVVTYRFSSGKIVEGRTVPVDLYAFDEFWS
jgi:ketosteroid isomerase-like protein